MDHLAHGDRQYNEGGGGHAYGARHVQRVPYSDTAGHHGNKVDEWYRANIISMENIDKTSISVRNGEDKKVNEALRYRGRTKLVC